MIRRKDITEELLPAVDSKARAFAYRPYPASFVTVGQDSDGLSDASSSDDEAARIVERRVVPNAEGDRQQMARLHASAAYARIREARRLVDDSNFEYACDVVYECQRGFNFLGKANFSTKLLHPMDPPAWSDTTLKLTVANVHSFQVPDPSWQWVSPRWLIDMTQDVDEDGWQYASRFASDAWHSRYSAAKSFVRRRRWLRLRRRPQHGAVGAQDQGEFFNHEVDQPAAAQQQGKQQKQRRRASARPADMAAKIKNKVSRTYVGRSPKVREGRELVYTLKDGKYQSHRPQRLGRSKSITLADAPSCASATQVSSPASLHLLPLDNNDDGVSSPASQQVPLAEGDVSLSARKRHDSGNSDDDGSGAPELLRQVQRSMSTLWQQRASGTLRAPQSTQHRRQPSEVLASPTDSERSQGTQLPRLVPRMAPEPTVPREDICTALGRCLQPNASDISAVAAAAARRPRSRHLWALKPVASAFLHGLSRRNSAVALAAHSVPVSPQRASAVEAAPEIPPNSPASVDEDTESTAVDSHLSLVIGTGAALQRRASALSLQSSAASTDDFAGTISPQLAAPYVDPYSPLQLSPTDTQQTANLVADKRLVELASETLQAMLLDTALDRERLQFLHACLRQGGITAATVWYTLPWLHYELLQFDSARQRLTALLLAHAHTCPPDALRYFSAAGRIDEHRAMRAMSERERAEYLRLMADVDCGREVGPMLPAQAWRLCVKPVVVCDPDLFYSDFKLMVVGVAKWELSVK